MQMHACEEPISIYKVRELRVARRAPGVTFLSGTGYIVKTDDSRPRADSPSGTVDCRWSLCKIRRRIITDERQRGAAAAPHDAPRRARTRVTRRRPGARRSPNRKGERRRRADYSETIRNPENRENIAQIESACQISIRIHPFNAKTHNGASAGAGIEGPNKLAIRRTRGGTKRLTMFNAFIHPHQHIPQMRCARKTSA